MVALKTKGGVFPRMYRTTRPDPEPLALYAAMHATGPDDDEDGDEDGEQTPLTTIVPWDVNGGDDDRRRAYQAGYAAGRNGDRVSPGPHDPDEYRIGYGGGATELARVEAAALANYDNWFTSAEWDALDTLGRHFGPVSFDGRTAWVGNMSAHALRWWMDRIGLGHLPNTEWVITAPPCGGLAVTVRGGFAA